MRFKDFNNIQLTEITKKEFLNKVKTYDSIDTALKSLPDEYIEFYLLHINDLGELSESEEDKTLGFAPQPEKIIKQIKYKGQYITVEYDPELKSWFPAIRFRSIVTALKYIKNQVNYNAKEV